MKKGIAKVFLAIGAIIIGALSVMGIISGIQSLITIFTNQSWDSIPGLIRGVGTNLIYLIAALAGLIIVFTLKESWFAVAKVFAIVLGIFIVADMVAMLIYVIKTTVSMDYEGIFIRIISPSLMTVAGIFYVAGVRGLSKQERKSRKK